MENLSAEALADISHGVRHELTTKLAWAVASTLHVGYGRKSFLRKVCGEVAQVFYDRKLEWMDRRH